MAELEPLERFAIRARPKGELGLYTTHLSGWGIRTRNWLRVQDPLALRACFGERSEDLDEASLDLLRQLWSELQVMESPFPGLNLAVEVRDADGLLVLGAQVAACAVEVGLCVEAVTDNHGTATLRLAEPRDYLLTVQLRGFLTVRVGPMALSSMRVPAEVVVVVLVAEVEL